MAAPALVAAALLRLAAAQVATWDAALDGSTRGRAPDPGEQTGEVSVGARAALGLEGRRHGATVAYLPRAVFLTETGRVTALHAGLLSTEWRYAPRWRAEASATGSYGERDFLLADVTLPATAGGAPAPGATPGTPSPVAPAEPLPVPTLARLPYASGALTLGVAGAPGPRSAVRLSVRGGVEGGTTAAARAAYAERRNAGFSAGHEWTVSRRDVLESTLDGTGARFVRGPTTAVAALTVTWRRELSARTGVWIGAGPTMEAEAEDGERTALVAAGGEAGIRHRLFRPIVEGGASVRVAPVIDRISGTAYHRADGTAAVQWQATTGWLLRGIAAAGVATNGPQQGDRVVSGEAEAAWSRLDRWTTAFGVRWLRQEVAALTLQEWSAYVSAGWRIGGRL
jgi:hypothetical protein